MAEIVFSVSQINEYLRKKLSGDPFLSNVTIVGEVTNFCMSSVGHVFFSLKDEENMLGCIIYDFESNASKDNIVDGAMIKAKGRISFYKRSASLQLAVASAEAVGLGDLYERFEQTKRKLAEEGIFDAEHKQALPTFPVNIGVVTSAAGAALHDIISVSTRRFKGVSITVFPAQVQGQGASRQLCSGIKHFNDQGNVDVIIVGRGGGSFEDLFAFNEESVARAVYDSKIPIVSAVGHETDFSLCDMAADLRAPTPSAAAELVVTQKQDVIARIDETCAIMKVSLAGIVSRYGSRLTRTADLIRMHPFRLKLTQALERVKSSQDMFKKNVSSQLERYALILEKHKNSLISLNPRNVLQRGYALVFDGNDNVVASAADAAVSMNIEFHDGRVAVIRKDKSDG